MKVELFSPARDAASKIKMRSNQNARLRNLEVGEAVTMIAHPSQIRMALLKASVAMGNCETEYIIERASDYSAAKPRHRITRTA